MDAFCLEQGKDVAEYAHEIFRVPGGTTDEQTVNGRHPDEIRRIFVIDAAAVKEGNSAPSLRTKKLDKALASSAYSFEAGTPETPMAQTGS